MVMRADAAEEKPITVFAAASMKNFTNRSVIKIAR
jgi:hypothetical protein